ncbi:MAG TPA: hypothetical protein VK935_23075 [Actinomycetospora sp.]|nr:hypothetical protein [Actinomycetospora sp.]
MTTAERSAAPTITAEAAAAVPPPLRRLLRVRKPWSTPLAFVATAAVGIFSILSWVEVADRGRPPTWAVIGAVFGSLLTLCLGIVAVQMLRDAGLRFRTLYAELCADRPNPAPPAVVTDEVRLLWGGPDRAAVVRAGRPLAELRPDLPVTAPLLVRSWKNRAPLVDGDGGRGADAILDADGTRWRLTLAAADGPAGVAHRCPPGGDDDCGEYLVVDGRRALEVQSWFADADLRWWDLPRPTIEALRAGEPLIWPHVPRHLTDSAVAYLLWRRVARTLQAAAQHERDERDRAASATANAIT